MKDIDVDSSILYLHKRKYAILTAIIIITGFGFLLFFLLGSYRDESKKALAKDALMGIMKVTYAEMDLDTTQSNEVIYLVGNNMVEIQDVLKFQKFKVKIFDKISELTEEVTDSYVIIDAEILADISEIEYLQKLIGLTESKYIIYHIESLDLKEKKVKELLGIEDIKRTKEYIGIRILDGFWTDIPFTEKEYEFNALDIKIKNGRQVYITQYAKNYQEEEVIPLLYREVHGNSEVYVVNGPLMDEIPHGILRGIFNQESTYIYPIVNASFLAITSFPVLSNENSEELHEKYNRGSRQFSEDILIPNMMILCKNLNQKPTIYVKPYIKEKKDIDPILLTYYKSEVEKYDGELGIMFDASELLDWDAWNQNYMGGHNLGSFCTDSNDIQLIASKEIVSYLGKIENTTLPIQHIEQSYVSLNPIYDLINRNAQSTLSYCSSVFAYGISAIGADMEIAYYPESEEFNEISKRVSEELADDVYYIKLLTPRTVHETALEIEKYNLMNPVIEYKDQEINIHIDNFVDEISFILKTDKKIVNIDNGYYTEKAQGVYLVSITSADAKIMLGLTKLDFLGN